MQRRDARSGVAENRHLFWRRFTRSDWRVECGLLFICFYFWANPSQQPPHVSPPRADSCGGERLARHGGPGHQPGAGPSVRHARLAMALAPRGVRPCASCACFHLPFNVLGNGASFRAPHIPTRAPVRFAPRPRAAVPYARAAHAMYFFGRLVRSVGDAASEITQCLPAIPLAEDDGESGH